MLHLAAGVDVPGLHPFVHRGIIRQDTPQDAVQGAGHGHAVHRGGHIPLPHLGANVQQLVKHAVRRGPQHSFPGKAADEPRDPGIGQRTARMDHPAQRVAPHGLHHRVTVHPGSEARPHADDHRGIGDPGAQIPLGQEGVHHHVRLQNWDTDPLRVRQHRDYILLQKGHSRLRCLRPAGGDVLHLCLSQHDGLGEGYGPPDGSWGRYIGHNHRYMRPFQPQSNTGGQITGASDDYQHGKYSLLHRLPARTGQSIRRARTLASARFHSVST